MQSQLYIIVHKIGKFESKIYLFINFSRMIMKDEQFYSQPEVFNPENFSPEKKSDRSPFAFLAFGHGPRICIGMRFALLQVKTAIVRLVFNYKILRSPKTVDELIPDPLSRSMMPKGGIWIKVETRN
jgi:cytochrome P450